MRWNAPFYAKHGFVVVDKDDPAFAYARQRDRENGFPDHLRVFMSRPLSAPGRDEWTVWPGNETTTTLSQIGISQQTEFPIVRIAQLFTGSGWELIVLHQVVTEWRAHVFSKLR